MKLTRLRVIGFKSFVEPTDFQIEPGRSAICFPVSGLTSMRRIKIAPIGFPSRNNGVASVVLCPYCLA